MKIFRPITRTLQLLAALILPTLCAVAQEPSDPPVGASGTEYYVAFMQNEDSRGSVARFMGLMITSEVATSGTVDIPGQGIKTFTTQPGQVTTIEIPRTLELSISEEIAPSAVHITSRAPVAVYVLNSLYQSTGGYAALPVNYWGKKYLPMSLPNADGARTSEFTIIAAYDSTFVTIFPSEQTYRYYAGQNISLVLQKGETFLVQALPGLSGKRDLSGSEIVASNRIGVVTGHVRTPIALDGSLSSTDWASHAAAMLLPESSYGTRYYSLPQRPGRDDLFRVMPLGNGTTVTVTQYPVGGAPIQEKLTLDRGEVVARQISSPAEWVASGPIVLMQLRTSGSYGSPANAPAMIPLVPVERYASRSVIAAPVQIGGDYFMSHSLTIIAKGPSTPSATDPANPLRDIMLDDKPLYQIAPELLTQQGWGDDLYYATIPNISSGGHLITSRPGYPFTGIAVGNNGDVARDEYTWTIPFWMEQVGPDVTAPHIVGDPVPNLPKGTIQVMVTDRTASYFSGVANVVPHDSPGWEGNFSQPGPDEDAPATFKAISDPSGPLYAELRDRDGNDTIVKISDGVCFKTAVPEVTSTTIMTSAGAGTSKSIRFDANPCGDPANVQEINKSGDGSQFITAEFRGMTPPFTIPSGGSAMLDIIVDPSVTEGNYSPSVTVRIDGSTFTIPITLSIGPKSGVDPVTGISLATLNATIYPNPFSSTTTIALDRPLGRSSRVTVTDALGREVYEFSSDALSGRRLLTWSGIDRNSVPVPAGPYFVTIADGGSRIVRGATVVR
jgi:hypothetical protein